jgi:hypothetical protein
MTKMSRTELRQIGTKCLEEQGYFVRPLTGRGRPAGAFIQLEKDGVVWLCAVRTTNDRWIPFKAKPRGGWETLDDVQRVLIVATDKKEGATRVDVFLLEAKNVRQAFDAAYAARKAAGHIIRDNTPWVGIDAPDISKAGLVTYVGAGFGKDALWVKRLPLAPQVGTSTLVSEQPSVGLPEQSRVQAHATIRDIIEGARRQIALAIDAPVDSVRLKLEVGW